VTTNTKRRTESRESTDGRCGKRLSKVYGKRLATITPNGTTLSLTLKNNLNNNPSCLKMIPISWRYKQICNKERKENKKITLKPTSSRRKETNL
jgi:hypothetical protein